METRFQELLRASFLRRNAANQRYSLRAFARDLDMEPAQLSRILSCKQKLSAGKAHSVAEKLFESPVEREYFVSLVEAATARREKARHEAESKVRRLEQESASQELPADSLRSFSSWLHVAILDLAELVPISGGQHARAARLLGVSGLEAKLAIESLLQAGLLIPRKGRLRKCAERLRTSSGIPSAVIRSLHKQLIGKALEAIDTQSVEERYLSAKTLTIARADLPKVRALIDELNRKLGELAAAPGKKNELYQVNLQAFRLWKGEKE